MYPLYLFQIKPVLRMPPKKKIRKKSGQMPKQESLQNCKMPWLTMAEQRKRQKCKERKRKSREGFLKLAVSRIRVEELERTTYTRVIAPGVVYQEPEPEPGRPRRGEQGKRACQVATSSMTGVPEKSSSLPL